MGARCGCRNLKGVTGCCSSQRSDQSTATGGFGERDLPAKTHKTVLPAPPASVPSSPDLPINKGIESAITPSIKQEFFNTIGSAVAFAARSANGRCRKHRPSLCLVPTGRTRTFLSFTYSGLRQLLSIAVVSLILNSLHRAICLEYRFFARNWHPVKQISRASVEALPVLVKLLTKSVFLAVSV